MIFCSNKFCWKWRCMLIQLDRKQLWQKCNKNKNIIFQKGASQNLKEYFGDYFVVEQLAVCVMQRLLGVFGNISRIMLKWFPLRKHRQRHITILSPFWWLCDFRKERRQCRHNYLYYRTACTNSLKKPLNIYRFIWIIEGFLP